MTPHLLYATSATFPSQLANRKQVVNQMRAFSALRPAFRATLAIASGARELADEPFACIEAGTRSLVRIIGSHIRVIRQQQVTHVYCREPRVLTLLVMARVFRLVPRTTVIGFEIHSLSIDAWLLKHVLARADRIVAVNAVLARDAQSLTGMQALIAHDAADPQIFMPDIDQPSARQELGIPLEGIVAAYTGRFRTIGMDKGLESVIRVLPKLAEEGRTVRVYAVGGAEEEIAAYTSYAREYGAEAYITFVPYQPQRIVALYHMAADILLMPFPNTRHFAYAMSPLKLFEYLMAGRPIIATNLPSIADILKTGALYTIDPNNDEELREALAMLYDDPALRMKLGVAARDVSIGYTWDARAQAIAEWIGIYKI